MKYFKTCQILQHHTRCPSLGDKNIMTIGDIFPDGLPSASDVKYNNASGASVGSQMSIFPLFKPDINIRIRSMNLITTGPNCSNGASATEENALRSLKIYRSSSRVGNSNLLEYNSNDLELRSFQIQPDANGSTFSTLPGIQGTRNRVLHGDDPSSMGEERNIIANRYVYLKYDSSESASRAPAAPNFNARINIEYEELPTLIGGNSSVNLANIYCYSFALKPEEHQPSGTCNFSRIDNSQLIFDHAAGNANTLLKVFAVNYNVLRIMSGMGGLAYSN
jgi:hypothetical protein